MPGCENYPLLGTQDRKVSQGEMPILQIPGFPAVDVEIQVDPGSAGALDGSVLRIYRRIDRVNRCTSERKIWASDFGPPIIATQPRYQGVIARLRGACSEWTVTLTPTVAYPLGDGPAFKVAYAASEMPMDDDVADDDRPHCFPQWGYFNKVDIGAGWVLRTPFTVLRQLYVVNTQATACWLQALRGHDVLNLGPVSWEGQLPATVGATMTWDFRDVSRWGRKNDGLGNDGDFGTGVILVASSTPGVTTPVGAGFNVLVGAEWRSLP